MTEPQQKGVGGVFRRKGLSDSRAGAVSIGRPCTTCHTLSYVHVYTRRLASPVGFQGARSLGPLRV